MSATAGLKNPAILPQHKLTTRCQETKTNPAWVTIQNILVKEERNTPMIRMLALDLLHSSELRPRVFFYKEKWTRLKRPGDVEGRWGVESGGSQDDQSTLIPQPDDCGGRGLTFHASSDWSRFRNLGLGKNPQYDDQVSRSNSSENTQVGSLWSKRAWSICLCPCSQRTDSVHDF